MYIYNVYMYKQMPTFNVFLKNNINIIYLKFTNISGFFFCVFFLIKLLKRRQIFVVLNELCVFILYCVVKRVLDG